MIFVMATLKIVFSVPQKVVISTAIKESSRRFSKTSGFGTNDLKSCMLVQIYTFGKTEKILWDNLAGFLKT